MCNIISIVITVFKEHYRSIHSTDKDGDTNLLYVDRSVICVHCMAVTSSLVTSCREGALQVMFERSSVSLRLLMRVSGHAVTSLGMSTVLAT